MGAEVDRGGGFLLVALEHGLPLEVQASAVRDKVEVAARVSISPQVLTNRLPIHAICRVLHVVVVNVSGTGWVNRHRSQSLNAVPLAEVAMSSTVVRDLTAGNQLSITVE